MHQLLESWKESLLFFKPVHFKFFLLNTFKTAFETYKLLFRYFWWLVLIYVMVAYYYVYPIHAYYHAYPIYLHAKNYLINWIVELFFVFVVFLAARPSATKKNFAYFIQRIVYFVPFFVWGIIVSFFMLFARHTGANFSGPMGILIGAIFYSLGGAIAGLVFFWILLGEFLKYIDAFIFIDLVIVGLMTIWLFPLIIFFILFLLDSGKYHFKTSFFSAMRALKMTWYNYPFCFIMHMFLVVIGAFFNLIIRYLLSYSMAITVHNLGIILLSPIAICLFTNFYGKRVKEQYKIYFEESLSMWE
ncbi:hypothetical protein E3J79_01810 [Candidatus Dependentiae bacterium]|nr:MAG: hypothetical protein E3J79_01810 [Candidatus Dependentiae bacterium]